MLVDEQLPYEEFYAEHGIELFTMFFKLTSFGPETRFCVLNKNTDTLEIESHANLQWVVCENVKRVESQINYVVNNLLLKQITAVKDKFTMLVYTAELMYSQDVKSTKRVAKVMALYSKLFRSVEGLDTKANEKHKFLMGSLYALGGLLKIEAKSYLLTMNEKDPKDEGFRLVCPLSNAENPLDESEAKFLRKLSDDDMDFFRTEFYLVVRQFVRSIGQGLDGVMNDAGMDQMLDLTNENYYD